MDADSSCRGGDDDRPPSSIHRLEFDVDWPPKHAAAYLIDAPNPILVDAGTPDEAGDAALETGLDRLGYEPADVDHVLVTHPHTDHVGQLPALREAGATVYAPRAAIAQLERDPGTVERSVREGARSAGYREDALERVVERTIDSLERNRCLVDPDAARPIAPAEPFTVGGTRVRPIETPGHQVHHLCYEATVEGTTVLFSGDALIEPFRPGAFHVGLEPGASEAIDAFSTGLDRLETTAATRVFPGHGPAFTDPRRVIRLTRDRIDDLLAKTLSTLESIEPATPLSIARERVGEMEYLAPVLDAIGALGTLTDRGDVRFEVEDGVRYYSVT